MTLFLIILESLVNKIQLDKYEYFMTLYKRSSYCTAYLFVILYTYYICFINKSIQLFITRCNFRIYKLKK